MNEIKCEVIRDLLPLYKDGEASPETEELVREHLADCPACREDLRKISAPVSLPPDEDSQLLERFNHKRREKRRRKRRNTLIGIGAVLAAIAMFCLWYTHIPRSWQDISRAGKINSLHGSYANTVERSGTTCTQSAYQMQDMDSDHPAAQVIISALEGRSYRADLGNLRPDLFLPDVISVDGTVPLHLYLRTQKRGPMVITIFNNGLLAIGGLTSMTPQGCLSYRTDKDLYQEVFEIMQEYSTYEEYSWIIEASAS